jgi:hypothetical protein
MHEPAPLAVFTGSSIHPRLPHHSLHPTATHPFRPRVDACPIRREAPARGPLAKSLDLVARSHSHGHHVLIGLDQRSLLAAERSSWVVGVVVGGAGVWPVSVVVAVDMGASDLLGKVNGKDRPRRQVAARSEKAPGWRRFSGPRAGYQAPGRPIEPSATEWGSVGREMLDEGRGGTELIARKRPARNGSRAAVARGKSHRF